jgi:hypothetical protein
MRGDADVDVAVAAVFSDVAQRIRRAGRPIAAPRSNGVADDWVAAAVKRQRLVGPHRCSRQRHVDAGRVGLRCLHGSRQTLGILLRKDRLLIQLVV